jgi:hypothetical protein
MRSALSYLQMSRNNTIKSDKMNNLLNAKRMLQESRANKGGYRILALNSINNAIDLLRRHKRHKANMAIQRAINQTQLGIDYY